MPSSASMRSSACSKGCVRTYKPWSSTCMTGTRTSIARSAAPMAPREEEADTMTIKAQFNNSDEFLEELAQESDQVTDRILRVTCLHKQQPGMPITQLSVVAGARVRGVLLEFVAYCG